MPRILSQGQNVAASGAPLFLPSSGHPVRSIAGRSALYTTVAAGSNGLTPAQIVVAGTLNVAISTLFPKTGTVYVKTLNGIASFTVTNTGAGTISVSATAGDGSAVATGNKVSLDPNLTTGLVLASVIAPAGQVVRVWAVSWGMWGAGANPAQNTNLTVLMSLTDSGAQGLLSKGNLNGFANKNEAPNLWPNSMNGQMVSSLAQGITLAFTDPGASNIVAATLMYEVSAPRSTDLLSATQAVLHGDNSLVIPAPGVGKAIYLAQIELTSWGSGASGSATNPWLTTFTDSNNGLIGITNINGNGGNGGFMPNNNNSGWVWVGSNNGSLTADTPDLGANVTSHINLFYRLGPAVY